MLEGICAKIGQRCHVSRATAKNDFVPLLKIALEKQKLSAIASWLKLEPEEVDFLAKMNKF
jgi:hypothetical protein